MAKVKNKRNSGLADKVNSKKKGAVVKKKLNPFEVHINREKFKVLGQKSKHDRGLPGVSRSKAIQKRKETLGTELKLYNKTNTFIDRRIGEKDTNLTLEERNVARFAAERAKQHGKKNIYNLADDEVLTHRGQTLEQVEKFDDPRSSDDDDEDDGRKKFGGLDDEFVSEGHFGGGVLTKTTQKDGAKSHKDLIDQLIAESKKRKAEKQKQKEQTLDLTEKLDSEWKDLQPVVLKKARVEESAVDRLLDGAEKNAQDYDKMMRELRFEKRGTPSDALKSDEQTTREERQKLEQFERERLQRMLGEEEGGNVRPVYGNHRSAEDLDDNFDLEETHDYMLAYDNEGNPLLPDHVLNDKYVPGSKKNFEDGISDSSDEEGDEESGDDDDDDDEELSPEGEEDSNIAENTKTDEITEKKSKKKDDTVESDEKPSSDSDDDDDEQSSSGVEDDSRKITLDDDEKTKKSTAITLKQKSDNITSQNHNDKSESDTDTSSDDDSNNSAVKIKEKAAQKPSKKQKVNIISTNDNDKSECESDIEMSDIKQILQPDSSDSDNDIETEHSKVTNNKNKQAVNNSKTDNNKIKLNNENKTKHKENNSEDNMELNGLSKRDSLIDNNSEIDESDAESDSKRAIENFDNLDDLRNSDDSSDDDDKNDSESVNDIDDSDKLKSFFDKSEEANNLKELLLGKSPNQQSIALDKLIKTHDPSLGENNKESLSRLFAHLLQYINDLFTNLTQESEIIKSFLIFDKLCPHLYDLAQTNKVSTKKFLADVLKEKHGDFKKTPKIVPDLDTLVFFKLVSLLYPTSDYRHPITTPSIVFMSEILTLSRFRDAYSITRGLFIVILLLEYTVLSKRFVPAAINFLRGILYLASNTSILNPIQVVPPFKLHRDVKILKLEDDCSKITVKNKMAATDFVLKEIDNDFKIRVLNTSVVIFKEFFDNYSDIEAQEFIFDSHIKLLGRIDVENYPKRVGEVLSKSLNYMKQCLEVKTYTPLTREKKKPKMLRMYEPDVQEVFTGNKNNKQPREKIERDKMQHKYKKAMKGALREIRRDKSFIASVKIKQKIQSDIIRKEKVKQIYKDASIQQGELNKLKRVK